MSYDAKAHSEYLEEKAVADLNGGYTLEKLVCPLCSRDKKVISTNGSGRWQARVYACPDWPNECSLATKGDHRDEQNSR